VLEQQTLNGASRQPTTRQNRRPEAANDAGIARKRRATALTAAQCGYALTRVHPGYGQPSNSIVGVAWVVSLRRVINSITGDAF